MMNRTIAVASRLATKTSWKSKALQQHYRSYVSPTPLVNAAAAAAEEAVGVAAKTTTKKKTSTKKSDEEKANKHMLVGVIAEKHEVSLAEAGRILDTVTETIVGALKVKKEVSIAGFGKFSSKTTKARTARNPSNGAIVNVPEKNRVSFSAFSSLKESVNESMPAKK